MKTLQQEEAAKNAYANAGLIALDRVTAMVNSGKLAVSDIDDVIAASDKIREYLVKEK